VIAHLATGGMAQIYLARQTGLGSFERHVVLKTILRERANDQRFVTMFLDEAKLAATLNHQNVAQVYEVDQADGAYFMAMEYVHGENARAILETTIRRGWTVPLELALMIISGAAAGLHHAHERRGKNGQPLNIVHRDVSPANIMVGYDGSVKVLDFGIAKAEERATKTVGGTIKGKYGYMSPEQCKGKPIDRRSDIFALGIVLYEMTTLRRAFKGNDDFETMKRIVAGDVVLPTVVVPGYPRELEAILLTAMANDPNARFQSAQELIEAIDAFAVRAKLTGSNTAMSRFMAQLFGTKKEPWVDGGQAPVIPGDKTDISDPDLDNEKTTLVEGRPDLYEPPRVDTMPFPPVDARRPDAAAWGNDADQRQRPIARPLFHPNPPAMPPSGQLPAGSQPPMYVPPQPQHQPVNLLPPIADEISQAGAVPLIDDKLGWETSPGAKLLNPSAVGATRLDSEPRPDHRIRRPGLRWIVIALILVALAGAAVVAAVLWDA
jgi:eukaryotic-like serine/threonine-protein kinase